MVPLMRNNAIRQSDDGVCVNFLADEGETRIHAAYPGGTCDRLAEIKRRYDPDNLFRLNQNIPPAERYLAPSRAGRGST